MDKKMNFYEVEEMVSLLREAMEELGFSKEEIAKKCQTIWNQNPHV